MDPDILKIDEDGVCAYCYRITEVSHSGFNPVFSVLRHFATFQFMSMSSIIRRVAGITHNGSFPIRFMNSSLFLTQVYLRHIYELRAFLLRRVGCREVAAELAQETFIRIMHYQTDETLQNARAMLYRIASNLATDYHRVQIRLPDHVSIDELPSHDMPFTDASDPARILFARQILEKLCAIIEELPPQCQRVFVLHKFDGLSHAEIADQLEITRNAVEKLLIRALVRLRQVLG